LRFFGGLFNSGSLWETARKIRRTGTLEFFRRFLFFRHFTCKACSCRRRGDASHQCSRFMTGRRVWVAGFCNVFGVKDVIYIVVAVAFLRGGVICNPLVVHDKLFRTLVSIKDLKLSMEDIE
jgi:hypothetical protein